MLTSGYRRNFAARRQNSIIVVMAMDGVIFDFLGNIAVGFAATIAVLAVVGLSIPTRAARASRNHPPSR